MCWIYIYNCSWAEFLWHSMPLTKTFRLTKKKFPISTNKKMNPWKGNVQRPIYYRKNKDKKPQHKRCTSLFQNTSGCSKAKRLRKITIHTKPVTRRPLIFRFSAKIHQHFLPNNTFYVFATSSPRPPKHCTKSMLPPPTAHVQHTCTRLHVTQHIPYIDIPNIQRFPPKKKNRTNIHVSHIAPVSLWSNKKTTNQSNVPRKHGIPFIYTFW